LEYTRLLNQNDRKLRNTGRSFHSKKRIYRKNMWTARFTTLFDQTVHVRHQTQDIKSKTLTVRNAFSAYLHYSCTFFRRICRLPGFFPPRTHCTVL